uniref:DEAD/DEAH box helicase n=1 Tax=Legionella tunisiensis TaxID=1034944 RepID=UPI0005934761
METTTNFSTKQAKATHVLKNYFGFDAFRHPQEEIINELIAGHDLLVLMPTGGGKSLCYQVPALVRAGVGIVVSPLIALMEDQVAALKLQGIRAAYYNSSLSSEEARQVLAQLHNNELDLLYVAPERLVSQAFLER